MLVAHSHLKDSSIGKDFLPRLVLCRSNQKESAATQDLSEVSIGIRHSLGKERLHLFS